MRYTKDMVTFIKIGVEKDAMGAGDELRPKMESNERENAADEGPNDGHKDGTTI